MKKLIIAAMALLCSGTSAMALENEPEAGLTHRVYAGMGITNITHTAGNPKVGHSIGYIGEYILPECAGTLVNFGIDYSMLGSKYGSDKLRTHYVSIPLHIGYRYNILDNLGAYADFGPYFGLGLGGKTSKTDMKFFKKSEGDANRFDCGLGFRIGAEYNNRLSLTFGFNWGLTKLQDVPGKDPKNFASTITLGYRF